MGVQNINFFEQHVEKIVLGVAAAGAVFMGYLAMQPIGIPNAGGGDPVTAGSVEGEIAKALENVQSGMDKLPQNPTPQVPDYVAGYNKMAHGEPLDAPVLAAGGGAEFGPRNMSVGRVTEIVDNSKIVTPAPVGPETDSLRAEALQVQVNTEAPQLDNAGAPVPLPAGTVLRTHSVNVVVVDGYVPVGKMIREMLSVQDTKEVRVRLGAELQKAEVYRIVVSRKEQMAGGAWGGWSQPLPPTKGSAKPVDMAWNQNIDLGSRLTEVGAGFKQIMLPDFYRKEDGTVVPPPILTRPLPANVEKEIQDLTKELATARANAVGLAVTLAGAAAAGPPIIGGMLPTGVETIKSLPVVPFTFWDETVEPDHKYQYQVEVQIVNPTYASRSGLANPDMKDKPFLSVGAVVIPGIVVVHSDMAFYIQNYGGMGGSNKLSGNIYKQDNGQWYRHDFTVDIGANIETLMKLSSGQANVDTKFTVVDCQAGNHVILRDPTGNLVTRELPDDWNQQARKDLDEKATAVLKAAALDAATPATPGVPTTPPTTPGRGPATTPGVTPRGPTTRPGSTPVPTGRGAASRP